MDNLQLPNLRRNISFTITEQKKEGSCMSHVHARILLQNLFYFINKDISNEKIIECNRFLNTTILLVEMDKSRCGIGGVQKIIMFRLFFYLNYLHYDKQDTDYRYINNIFRQPYYPSLDMIQNAPYSMIYSQLLIEYTLQEITNRNLHWTYFSVIFRPSWEILYKRIIEKITHQGFYVKILAFTVNEMGKINLEQGHALTIVDVIDDLYIIKNSWGKDPQHIETLNVLELNKKPYIVTTLEFYLPVNKTTDLVILTESIKDIHVNYYNVKLQTTITYDMYVINELSPIKAEQWVDAFCDHIPYLKLQQIKNPITVYDYIFEIVSNDEQIRRLLHNLKAFCNLNDEIIEVLMRMSPKDRFIKLVGQHRLKIKAEFLTGGKTKKYKRIKA